MKKIALAASLLVACPATVNVTVKNPKPNPQLQVELADKDGNKVVGKTYQLGIIQPDGNDVKQTVKVDKNHVLEVRGSIPGSAIVWKDPHTIIDDPTNLTSTLGIDPALGRVLDPDLKAISDKLLDLGPGYGFASLKVRNALKALFGGLVVFEPPDPKNGTPLMVYKTYPPTALKNETKFEDFKYPSSNQHLRIETMGNGATKLSASFAVFNGLGTYSSENAYRFDSKLNNFGPVAKESAADFNLNNALGESALQEIASLLKAHPAAIAMYINRMWVVEAGGTDLFESQKQSTAVEASVGSFVSVNGVFTFSSSSSNTKNFAEIAFEFWGEQVATRVVPAATVSPRTNVSAVQSLLQQGAVLGVTLAHQKTPTVGPDRVVLTRTSCQSPGSQAPCARLAEDIVNAFIPK